MEKGYNTILLLNENGMRISGKDGMLEATNNICSTSYTQLLKIKRCLEKVDEVSKEKALNYLDDVLGFLQRQRRKY